MIKEIQQLSGLLIQFLQNRAEIIQQLDILVINFLRNIWNFLEPFLQNPDPSLFQNITLGVLALLIPVGVGMLSFFFKERSEGKLYSNLELFILVKTVLNADGIAVYSLIGLFLFAIFSISLFIKIYAILFFIFYVAWLFIIPFKNIWKWFFESTEIFSINFLNGLNVKKDKNIILDSWKALWLVESVKENEREFTKIFISHIDDAIKYKKFELAIQLSQTYVNNIEKRNRFSISYEILPKIFEWNEVFWSLQEKERGKYNTCDLYYFSGDFFQAIIKVLVKDGHGSYQLFECFKKHIEESEKKLDEINEKWKEEYFNYIKELFASFCPTLFNEIDGTPSNYKIWKYFPQEWKIETKNKNNRISRIILYEFLQWSQERIFKKDDKDSFDKNLTNVINGIFPNVHSSLFTAFLMLFFSSDIKYALEKKSNFYISDVSVSWSGSVKESKEDLEKGLNEKRQKKEILQREEIIEIINNYFYPWPIRFPIHKDNLSEDEFENWKSFTEAKRKLIIKRVRKEKLEKMKAKIESPEIKKACEDSERKEFYRKNFLELIKLLLLKV